MKKNFEFWNKITVKIEQRENFSIELIFVFFSQSNTSPKRTQIWFGFYCKRQLPNWKIRAMYVELFLVMKTSSIFFSWQEHANEFFNVQRTEEEVNEFERRFIEERKRAHELKIKADKFRELTQNLPNVSFFQWEKSFCQYFLENFSDRKWNVRNSIEKLLMIGKKNESSVFFRFFVRREIFSDRRFSFVMPGTKRWRK